MKLKQFFKNKKVVLILKIIATLLFGYLSYIGSLFFLIFLSFSRYWAATVVLSLLIFPLIILAIMWICILITAKDNQKVDQNVKAFRTIMWIMPILSCVASSCIYAAAFGKEVSISVIMPLMLGIMFTAIGNYTPKMKQNRTMGIKIKWTLEKEENWNATHRFGGKVWFYGGFAFMLMALLPENIMIWAVLVGMLPLVFAPMIYSYLYYKKQLTQL